MLNFITGSCFTHESSYLLFRPMYFTSFICETWYLICEQSKNENLLIWKIKTNLQSNFTSTCTIFLFFTIFFQVHLEFLIRLKKNTSRDKKTAAFSCMYIIAFHCEYGGNTYLEHLDKNVFVIINY